MRKMLIIEDDPAISLGLQESFKEELFEVVIENDGYMGFRLAKKEKFDIIILDLMLPSKNGMDICKDLRKENINSPILMLTSKKEEMDKVVGLEIGADDYVTKPFSIRELIARVRALLRRSSNLINEITQFAFDDFQIDFKKMVAVKDKRPVELSSMEFSILKYFIERENEVISREQLLDDVWGYDSYPTTRTVDNFILSLRKKIEDNPSEPKHLITFHKVGYRFIK